MTLSTDVTKYQKALELLQRLSYLPTSEVAQEGQTDFEKLYSTPNDVILEIVHEVTGGRNIELHRLNSQEKMAVVKRLHDENFFLMKGAVVQIATLLESSEATIYRYLSKINKDKEERL